MEDQDGNIGTVVCDGHYPIVCDVETVTHVQLLQCLSTLSLGEGPKT